VFPFSITTAILLPRDPCVSFFNNYSNFASP